MKKTLLLLCLFFLAKGSNVFSQSTITMTGYPIVTTGWTVGGSAFALDSEIVLTPATTGGIGHVNSNTALNVTACGQFTVDFEYKISNPSGCGYGDGIAFFFINPMTSFVGGGGLGLPNPLTGFVLTMDTWDNDADGLNPEDELFGYPTASTYFEGDVAHHLAPILAHQTYMTDGTWHHVRIAYFAGVIRVYLNGATSPSMTGSFPITTAGYFGFSASTGCAITAQMVKNVIVTYNTVGTITGTTIVCVGSTTALADSVAGGTWTSGSTGVATVGSTTGVVTGVANGTAVITYTYNSGACTATTTINVVTPPLPITGTTSICLGTTTTLADATPSGTWSSSNPSVATIGSGTGLVTGVAVGTVTIT